MRPEDRSRDGGPAAQLYGRPSSPQRTGLLGLLVGSTLQGINISHLGKRKIIFKYALSGGYVNSLEGKCSEHLCWVIYIFQKHPHVNASNQREANVRYFSGIISSVCRAGTQPAKQNLLLMAKMLHQFIGTFFTLQGINISHLGKRKIIFKMPFLGDMLVPRRVLVGG